MTDVIDIPRHNGLIAQYFSFKGRISIWSYWYVVLSVLLISAEGFLLDFMIGAMGFLFASVCIVSVISVVALNIRRCHDCGRSGLLGLLSITIPIIGLWFLRRVGFRDGTIGNNSYGAEQSVETISQSDKHTTMVILISTVLTGILVLIATIF